MSRQLRLSVANLPQYLVSRGLVSREDEVSIESAGSGNINWVRRARIPGRSWVVKQARPTLEAFPEYAAPIERAAIEARYFATVAPFDATAICPIVHQFDQVNSVLILEDLGDAERLDAAQARGADIVPVARILGTFLGAVHAGTRAKSTELAEHFRNREMQRLHGEHIFSLPYRENDFPLAPPVAERAREIWRDAELVRAIDAAYERYLAEDACSADGAGYALLHADVQPGNVLISPAGPKLLDAEIAHVGEPAFDLGTLVAHLALPAFGAAPGSAQERIAREAVAAVWSAYAAVDLHEGVRAPRFEDVARYAGIELLRRTIGAARVAGVEREELARKLIEAGKRLITEGATQPEEIFSGSG